MACVPLDTNTMPRVRGDTTQPALEGCDVVEDDIRHRGGDHKTTTGKKARKAPTMPLDRCMYVTGHSRAQWCCCTGLRGG